MIQRRCHTAVASHRFFAYSGHTKSKLLTTSKNGSLQTTTLCGWSITTVAAFRGLIDLVLRRFIPWPSLFGTDDSRLKEEDVVNRRRAWFWRFWFRLLWLWHR